MQNVANLAQTLDLTDPSSMSKMQMAMMKMNMGVQMEAALVKSLEDMIKSVRPAHVAQRQRDSKKKI